MENDNYEPDIKDRIYYQHQRTGELAYLVRINGEEMLKTNRPSAPEYHPKPSSASTGPWILNKDKRPLNPGQIAKIAYVADCELRKSFGYMTKPKDWASMIDNDRISWVKNGPPKSEKERRALYEAIMDVVRGFST